MSLLEELKQERVDHLDLSGFCQATADTAVAEVLAQMQQARVNVCLVMDGGTLVGIFTERDVLQKVAAQTAVLQQPITTVMTANPVTATPDTTAAAALRLMDNNHFRNLPVVQADGAVLGAMTHQSIIRYLAARYPVEVLNRPPHLQYPSKPEGGD